MNLDDLKEMRRIDSMNMISDIDGLPDQIETAITNSQRKYPP